MGTHRKLVPTAAERLVWTGGDGSTLETFDTPFGRIGGLICWENYMPLARYAMYAAGTEIYVAPTWDRGDNWAASIKHIAVEGGVYVISCCMALRMADISDSLGLKEHYPREASEWINTGRSAIVDPAGNTIAGPLECKEGILYAEVDLDAVRRSRWMLDVAGHYARPDVFQLTVNRRPHPLTIDADEPLNRSSDDKDQISASEVGEKLVRSSG